ncbi:MAG: hypothetical protein PUE30_06020 [Spirochaetia bacterium]|nr:hypothetical protein [Spirochaetia bacterium]
MRKYVFLCILPFIFSLYAAGISDLEKKFIKGNIQDKTQAVKDASEQEGLKLSIRGIDFILENSSIAGDDRDFSALAVASLLNLPKDGTALEKNFPAVTEKTVRLFEIFGDETVRISIIDRFESLSNSKSFSKVLNMMNSCLKEPGENFNNSPVTKKTVEFLGDFGNGESFILVYDLWKKNTCPDFSSEVEDALVSLASSNITESIKLISSITFGEIGDFFELIDNSSKVSPDFKAEIAENALLATIHYMEDESKGYGAGISSAEGEKLASIQLRLLNAVARAKWTRGAALSVRFFDIARDEYKKSYLNDDQFIQVIEDVASLAAQNAAQTLSAYLAEINADTEKNVVSARNVVLAVINSLGELGDKTAFDNLLYVTYLNYPEDIKSAARNSLSKLKW